MLAYQVAERDQQIPPVCGRKVTPGRILERFPGGGDCCVDISCTSSVDRGDFGFVTARGLMMRPETGTRESYVGLMELMVLPSLLFTHSLLMKRPVGWVYFVPLGAVSSRWRSDMVGWVLNRLYNLGWMAVGGVQKACFCRELLMKTRE